MTLQQQIDSLIDENERLKSHIEWIEWYQTGDHARNEMGILEKEIILLEKRREAIIRHKEDRSTIPTLRERSKFIVGKIVELEKQEKARREIFVSSPRKDSRPRVGMMSAEKSLELARNLGMTVEDLQRILTKGCEK